MNSIKDLEEMLKNKNINEDKRKFIQKRIDLIKDNKTILK